jgi:hypothetical protein
MGLHGLLQGQLYLFTVKMAEVLRGMNKEKNSHRGVIGLFTRYQGLVI